MKVALICNTRQSNKEFEVEYDPPDTIKKIMQGIERSGHEALFIEANEDAYPKLVKLKPDLVFNRAEGIRGESRESQIPAFLEMLGIPYVGSNILTTATCLDKAMAKTVISFHKISTPRFQVLANNSDRLNSELVFPLILKPIHEGSSIGINEDNVVWNEDSLRKKASNMLKKYEEPILVEEFIEGRELSVGLLGNDKPQVLPILEVDFSKFPKELATVYGQKAKTLFDSSANYICPAKLSQYKREEIEDMSIRCFNVLNCRDFARIDFRMNKSGRLYVLEVNPLPGLDYDEGKDELSFYPIMAKASGLSYSEMVRKILNAAVKRYHLE